jgi:hemoglobin
MKDIETRVDLELLLQAFYNRLLGDDSISYMFTDVAKINLEAHLPHITDFWEQSLFYKGNYRKNVLQIHQDLNSKEKLTDTHFTTWLSHFDNMVDSMFIGENSDKIKSRAVSIATVMKIKFSYT